MHRSGTSAIAGGLAAAGAEFGTSLMPAAADNKKGFFEDTRVVALNNSLIERDLQAWDSVIPVPLDRAAQPIDLQFTDRARAILGSFRTNEDTVFGLKDPRTSLLVRFWQDAYADSNVEAIWVMCVRHPSRVAKSLHDRNGFSRTKSTALWLKYNISLLEGLAQCELFEQSYLLSFDRLCDNHELREQQGTVLLAGSGLSCEAFVDFFEPDLTAPKVSQVPENRLEALALSIHDSLVEEGFPAPEVVQEWSRSWRELEPVLSLIDLQYQHYRQFSVEEKRWLRDLQASVEAKDKELARLDGYTRELLAALEAQRSDLEKARSYQQTLEAELRTVTKERTLALSRARIYHQSASELEEVLSNRMEELSQRDHAIHALQRELTEVYSSTSWRLSYPVRALRRSLGRLLPGDSTG